MSLCKVWFLCSFLYSFICLFHKYFWKAPRESGTLLGARMAAVNRTNLTSLLCCLPCSLSRGIGNKQIHVISGRGAMNALKRDQMTVTVGLVGYFRYCHLRTFSILRSPHLYPFFSGCDTNYYKWSGAGTPSVIIVCVWGGGTVPQVIPCHCGINSLYSCPPFLCLTFLVILF